MSTMEQLGRASSLRGCLQDDEDDNLFYVRLRRAVTKGISFEFLMDKYIDVTEPLMPLRVHRAHLYVVLWPAIILYFMYIILFALIKEVLHDMTPMGKGMDYVLLNVEQKFFPRNETQKSVLCRSDSWNTKKAAVKSYGSLFNKDEAQPAESTTTATSSSASKTSVTSSSSATTSSAKSLPSRSPQPKKQSGLPVGLTPPANASTRTEAKLAPASPPKKAKPPEKEASDSSSEDESSRRKKKKKKSKKKGSKNKKKKRNATEEETEEDKSEVEIKKKKKKKNKEKEGKGKKVVQEIEEGLRKRGKQIASLFTGKKDSPEKISKDSKKKK